MRANIVFRLDRGSAWISRGAIVCVGPTPEVLRGDNSGALYPVQRIEALLSVLALKARWR